MNQLHKKKILDLLSLMILPWESRLWFKAHNFTVRLKIPAVNNWPVIEFSSFAPAEEYFRVFNKSNLSWSLTIPLIQIGKFRIIVWLALTILLWIGWNFQVWGSGWPSMLSKNNFYSRFDSKHKNQGMRIIHISFIFSIK